MSPDTVSSLQRPVSGTGRLKLLSLLCVVKLIQNIRHIDNVGRYPCYKLLEPVLSKMNPKQLLAIEARSPELAEDTNILWYRFVEKEFPDNKHVVKFRGVKDIGPSVDFRSIYTEAVSALEVKRAQALKNLKKNYKLLEKEKNARSAVALNEEKSIRMINLVANKKRKRMFFDNEFSSPVMKKVKKDVTSSRSNLFKTSPTLGTRSTSPSMMFTSTNLSKLLVGSPNPSSRSNMFKQSFPLSRNINSKLPNTSTKMVRSPSSKVYQSSLFPKKSVNNDRPILRTTSSAGPRLGTSSILTKNTNIQSRINRETTVKPTRPSPNTTDNSKLNIARFPPKLNTAVDTSANTLTTNANRPPQTSLSRITKPRKSNIFMPRSKKANSTSRSPSSLPIRTTISRK